MIANAEFAPIFPLFPHQNASHCARESNTVQNRRKRDTICIMRIERRWRVCGILLGFLAISIPRMTSAGDVPSPRAVVIQLQGEIDDYNRDQLFRRFDEARKFGATVVILDVDTYGGLVTAGEESSR